MYHAQLEQLTAFATGEPFKDEVLKAKEEYFAATGEVFEDDRSFEARMASFLEFYLFDRLVTGQGQTQAQLFAAERGSALGPAERAVVEGFSRTLHSLYEVRQMVETGVRVRDLFTDKEHAVFERRTMAGMNTGDLLEARLLPHEGRLLFSQAFCYHPRQVKGQVLKELRRQRRKPDLGFSPRSFLFTLSKMALKVERYRNIKVEDIYAFDRKTI